MDYLRIFPSLLLALFMIAQGACGDSSKTFRGESRILLSGEVPDNGEDFFFLPFEVLAGVNEIEVRHDDLSEENILDWGIDDPELVPRGLLREGESPEVLDEARDAMLDQLRELTPESRADFLEVEDEVRRALKRYFRGFVVSAP